MQKTLPILELSFAATRIGGSPDDDLPDTEIVGSLVGMTRDLGNGLTPEHILYTYILAALKET